MVSSLVEAGEVEVGWEVDSEKEARVPEQQPVGPQA